MSSSQSYMLPGSVSSNDSGHGSSYAQHETPGTSVYTAADCRLLQQISNTAARNLNSQCNNRALSPHPMALVMNNAAMAPPLPPPAATSLSPVGSSAVSTAAGLQMTLMQAASAAPPPPPYKPRTTQSGVPMYHVPMNPHSQPKMVLSAENSAANLMPPPSRYAASSSVMLHHPNHRHTNNMHGKLDADIINHDIDINNNSNYCYY